MPPRSCPTDDGRGNGIYGVEEGGKERGWKKFRKAEEGKRIKAVAGEERAGLGRRGVVGEADWREGERKE